jgi:hypothetical protein
MQHFEDACLACEFKAVVLCANDLAIITGHLKYDKRRVGSYGRALVCDVPRFGLRKGDRLEPTASIPDVGNVDVRSDFYIGIVLLASFQ